MLMIWWFPLLWLEDKTSYSSSRTSLIMLIYVSSTLWHMNDSSHLVFIENHSFFSATMVYIMVYIMFKVIYMIHGHFFQLLLGFHRYAYLPKHCQIQYKLQHVFLAIPCWCIFYLKIIIVNVSCIWSLLIYQAIVYKQLIIGVHVL